MSVTICIRAQTLKRKPTHKKNQVEFTSIKNLVDKKHLIQITKEQTSETIVKHFKMSIKHDIF